MKGFSRVRVFSWWLSARTYVMPALIAAAALSVLMHGLHDVGATDHGSLPIIVTAIVLMLTHCVYLLIMARHTVYQHSVEAAPGAAPFVIGLISLAYMALAAEGLVDPDVVKTRNSGASELESVAFAAFALAYFALWLRGRAELAHVANPFPRTIATIKYFRRVDGTFALLFFLYATSLLLSHERDAFPPPLGLMLTSVAHDAFGPHDFRWLSVISVKDLLITSCLWLYVYSTRIVASTVAFYDHDAYLSYMKHVEVDRASHFALPALAAMVKDDATWFDYGSGSGARLVEIIERVYMAPRSPKAPARLWLYDNNPHSYETLDADALSVLDSMQWPWSTVASHGEAPSLSDLLRSSDVVLLSHVLYDPATVRRILEDLEFLPTGTLVLIRVTGTTGIFRAISMAFANRLLEPSRHHAVPQIARRELCEHRGFKEEERVTLRQVYRIGDRGATTDLARWCDIRYGSTVSAQVKRYMDDLVHAGITAIRNDDELYVLRKRSR